MAKSTGMGARILVAGFDLSGDVGSAQRLGGGPAALDLTGIDKSAFERRGGVRDGAIDFNAWFNDAPAQAHAVLGALPTGDVHVLYFAASSIGAMFVAEVAKQTNYDGTRGADGSLPLTIATLANGFGVEMGGGGGDGLLTPGKRTDSGATNGTGLDGGAASANGLSAYLQVLAFTGTSVTVKTQESSDNGAGDPWADVVGGTFAAVTAAPATQRIQTAAGLTVERHLRAVTIGTFSNAVFAVAVVRHQTATL